MREIRHPQRLGEPTKAFCHALLRGKFDVESAFTKKSRDFGINLSIVETSLDLLPVDHCNSYPHPILTVGISGTTAVSGTLGQQSS